ncbi:hypothetical protein AEAC466_17430 [Asticcacaulis sp. AC466]|nr:hypothetical protein AEAC466_17430 [Asticcacaulis sp. AC466]
MRLIFMDEAGTSQQEPVTVVVGIIANADLHVTPAEALVAEAIGAVPADLAEGFVFHAKTVFGSRRYQDAWAMHDRLQLLKRMMSIPRRIGMAVAVSAAWRDAAVHVAEAAASTGMSNEQFQHYLAFLDCLSIADRNIRQYAEHNELAAVIAEDVPEMRKYLKLTARIRRDHPSYFKPEHLRWTAEDEALGYLNQSGDMRITRIRPAVQFVGKADDPLVQVADAVAFGFRRYFARQKFGEDFVREIIGNVDQVRDFGSPSSTGCFWPIPNPS